jgi:DNA-directed RNA polymerase subunit RPC12/RpoP
MSLPVIKCPHCNEFIEILELNCQIFRHGVFKNSLKQLNPHTPKINCDYYAENDLIYGCGKPFQLIEKDDTYLAIICDYI